MTLHYPTLPDYVGIDRDIDFGTYPPNSAIGSLHRGEAGVQISTETRIVFGPGTLTAPALQFTGSIRVLRQWGKITGVTTLTNCTDVHTDLWDDVAMNPKKLTRGNPGGAVLSGAPEGTLLFDGEDSTQPLVVMLADESRFFEVPNKTEGKPFTLNANPLANNYLRIILTTTDAPLDFEILFYFEYVPLVPGSELAFLL
jgi:hypothetical protein